MLTQQEDLYLGENGWVEDGFNLEATWVHVKQSSSQKFTQMAEDKSKTVQGMMQEKEVPQEYKEFASVFEKKVSEHLPERR
jgi:hypothetical protein